MSNERNEKERYLELGSNWEIHWIIGWRLTWKPFFHQLKNEANDSTT